MVVPNAVTHSTADLRQRPPVRRRRRFAVTALILGSALNTIIAEALCF